MNWWKKFWRLRKQEDRVKIAFLLFLLGIACLSYGFYNGIRLYQMVQTPVEYVLTDGKNDGYSGRMLKEIQAWENSMGVSICRESSLVITYRGQETAFSCVELSEDYIEKIYGLSQSGATKTFYMNQKAFAMVKEQENEDSPKQSDSEDTLRVSYEMETAEEGQTQKAESEQKEKKTAEIILVKEGVREEEPLVFSAEESGRLLKYGTGIRICSKGQDANGDQLRNIQEAGFTVENMQMYNELEYSRKLKEIHIKYAVGMSAICLFCAYMLWKTGKEK